MKISLRRRFRNLKCTARLLAASTAVNSPTLAYVGGWTGHRNLGDEALLAAYKQLFPNYGFLEYPCYMPKLALQICQWTRMCVAGFLAGGTLIGQWHADSVAPALQNSALSFVFGTGVANPAFWSSRDPSYKERLEKWKPVLERCDYLGVRGPASAEVLADMGLDNVEVIGDPVLVFADESCAARPEATTPSLGLNVGHSLGRVWGTEEAICEQYVRLAKTAKDHRWDINWFVVWEDDLETTLRIAQASGTADRIYPIYHDHRRFLDLARPLTAFVGMKLHAVVLSTCVYVPSIMVEYRPKCRDYMKSINQESMTVRGDKFDAGTIWEMVRSWESCREERSRSLCGNIQSLTSLQRTRAREIARKITLDDNVASAFCQAVGR